MHVAEAQDAAGVYFEVARSQKCITQIRKTLHTTVTGPQIIAMPRVSARQLLAFVAAARLPAASNAQPAASLWSSTVSPTGCSRSCTCSRCSTSGRQHGLSCGCSSCCTTVLGVPALPSGRMHLATLVDSQDKVRRFANYYKRHLYTSYKWAWECIRTSVFLQMDAINDRFTEAREEISIAHDDAETT
jgi:hypothetical protein